MERTPSDLKKIFSAVPKAAAQWRSLTPIARRDFVSWIKSAKQPETRRRRIESLPSRLAAGKRRPCCYAIVPMSLYSALNASPKAKAGWKSLTPDARRDFIGWIESAGSHEARERRIGKACAGLAAGRRRP